MLLEVGLTKEQAYEKLLQISGVRTQIEDNLFIKVSYDECEENPLNWGWCNLLSAKTRGMFSDDEYKWILDKSGEYHHIRDFESAEDVASFLEKNDYVFVCVSIHDHSAISLSECSPAADFSMDWDTGFFGFLYFSKADIRKELGKQRLSKKDIADYTQQIRSMINALEEWWNGEIYDIRFYHKNGEEAWEHEPETIWGYSALCDRLEEILGLSKKTA